MAAWSQPGFVAAIIGNDGKPIREHNENGQRVARIPFGSEYKVLIKNKTSARAYVNVEIDGMKAITNGKLLVRPGEFLDLERFVDSLNEGKKFKFVEAGNSAVQDPTSSENGRIRVIFEPESIMTTAYVPPLTAGGWSPVPPAAPGGWAPIGSPITSFHMSSGSILRGMSTSSCVNSSAPTYGAVNCAVPTTDKMSDAGATVDGGHSTQAFQSTAEWFPTLAAVTIDIWLKGPTVEVKKPFVCFPKLATAGIAVFYEGKVMHGVKEFSLVGGDVLLKVDAAHVEIKT